MYRLLNCKVRNVIIKTVSLCGQILTVIVYNIKIGLEDVFNNRTILAANTYNNRCIVVRYCYTVIVATIVSFFAETACTTIMQVILYRTNRGFFTKQKTNLFCFCIVAAVIIIINVQKFRKRIKRNIYWVITQLI